MNVPFSVHWAENGTTVAGQANGAGGSSINNLQNNEAIFIYSDDTLYIGDAGNNRIIVVQLLGMRKISTIGSGYGSNVDQFDYPSGVFVTDTAIYVMDATNRRVQKWSRNATNPITMPGSSYINYAYFLFIDQFNNLYLSDCSNAQVIRFAPNSSVPVIVAGDGTSGSAANQLDCPLGIFVDDVGTVYVADYWNHRIQKWYSGALSGITVAGTGSSGSSLTQLSNPKWVVVDTNGYMYIADTGNNRIIIWAPNATSGVCIIACTGTYGNRANQLNGAGSLAFDSNGSIYVSDMNNNRIQKFQILNNNSECIIIK
jgi:sugar lactone lactonase YvrE